MRRTRGPESPGTSLYGGIWRSQRSLHARRAVRIVASPLHRVRFLRRWAVNLELSKLGERSGLRGGDFGQHKGLSRFEHNQLNLRETIDLLGLNYMQAERL